MCKFEIPLDSIATQPTVFTNLEARFPDFIKCISYYNDIVKQRHLAPLLKDDVINLGRIIMADTEDYMEHPNLVTVLGDAGEYVDTSIVFTLAIFLYSFSWNYTNRFSDLPMNSLPIMSDGKIIPQCSPLTIAL